MTLTATNVRNGQSSHGPESAPTVPVPVVIQLYRTVKAREQAALPSDPDVNAWLARASVHFSDGKTT